MCGIAFYVTSRCQPSADTVAAVAPRGPDASADRVVTATDGTTFRLVFHRLAVVHATPEGMQPFDYGGSWTICNGEIYNYRALLPEGFVPRSDVDVIGPLVSGDALAAAVARLDGDFAFVTLFPCGRFVAGRDHVGVRPLFTGHATDGSIVALASEAKALVGVEGVDEIRVFPPGHVFDSRDGGGFTPYRTATVPCPQLSMPDFESDELIPAVYREGIRTWLTRAVAKRLDHSERPVGLLCSGGVDSAIITSLAATLRDPSKLHVFTMEYGDGLSEDALYARMLCARHGFLHTVVRFSQADVAECLEEVVRVTETYDPNTIRASIPMFLLARHIAQKTDIKVILSGEGADELFAGYNYFRFAPDGEALDEETGRLLSNLHMFDLLRADRCFAAWGLEVRVPYLDQDLTSYVRQIPGWYKMHEVAGEKGLLRRSFADLTDLVELRILDRPKERFSDGCGFSYVPQLLMYLSGPDVRDLGEKTAAEATRYGAIFERGYGARRHLITHRRLPDWTPRAGSILEVAL